MASRKVITLDRQSLVDIALQEHGNMEALFTVAKDAGLVGITDGITPGQLLEVKAPPIDGDPPAYYRARNQFPVTGEVKPVFFCAGANYHGFVSLDDNSVQVDTTSGYFTVRTGGEQTTYVSGAGGDTLIGVNCVWSSDAEGNPSGEIIILNHGGNKSAFYLGGLVNVEYLQLVVGAHRTVDLRACAALVDVGIYGDEKVKNILLPVGNNVTSLIATGCAIPSTDSLINSLNPLLANGVCNISGGPAPARTAASDLNYTRLTAGDPPTYPGGWTITTN